MAIFDFSGVLPTFKATIASSPLAARFNDIKNYLATTFNPAGINLPSADGSANQALVADGDTTTSWSHVLRSNVALNHDAGNGTLGQVLRSDGDGTTSWISFSGLTDGDKGDITVTGTGATWTIDNNVVTFAKMQTLSTNKLVGRSTAGTGNIESVSLSDHLPMRNAALTVAGTRTKALSYSFDALSGGFHIVVANTTTETNLLTGLGATFDEPDGEVWPTIAANTVLPGSTYRIKGVGKYTTTGTPTMQLKVKLGSTAVLDTTAIAVPVSGMTGLFEIDCLVSLEPSLGNNLVRAIGNGGINLTNVSSRLKYNLSNATETAITGVDMSVDKIMTVTFQWGTASASNRVFVTNLTVERIV